MKGILEKISWLTRRWNFKFRVLDLDLHDEFGAWGFEFFTVQYKYRAYSALAIMFRLPNKTTVNEFTIDDWDFLFLERFLWNWWESLSDRKLWGGKLTRFENIMLTILNKVVK
jgi:hypothetical protein